MNTMKFLAVKKALVALLATNSSAGQYRVIGFQQQKQDADQISEYNRLITAFYKSGTFANGSRPASGTVQHDMTFELNFLVAANAVADMSVLDDPTANQTQRQAALDTFYDAGAHADDLMDDFWSRIFNILEDPLNKNMNLADGTISEIPGSPVRLGEFQKSDVTREGQQVILAATATLKLRCTETPAGDPMTQVINEIDSQVLVTPDIQTGVIDPNQISAPPEADVKNLQSTPT